jgi:cobalt-zinc-cadmium efflux system membrane fusion protein
VCSSDLIEKTSYQARWALLQKEKTADTADLNLQTATQKLLALGLSQSEIKKISINQKLTRYEIRSPIKGTVIEKHITIGEAVKKDDNIYVLADLSDVWGKITIPSKDLQSVKEGQRVSVKSEKTGLKANGVLAHIHAAMDEKTQSVTGKVVIPNKEKKWRPGQFIAVEIVKEESHLPVAVSSEAIQTFRDWSVVFVKYGNLFEVRPLELGRNNGQWVEILEGLAPGEKYAAHNSFVLKAEVGKEGATHDH